MSVEEIISEDFVKKKAEQFARIMNSDRFSSRGSAYKRRLCLRVHNAYKNLSSELQELAIVTYEPVRYQESEATRYKKPNCFVEGPIAINVESAVNNN